MLLCFGTTLWSYNIPVLCSERQIWSQWVKLEWGFTYNCFQDGCITQWTEGNCITHGIAWWIYFCLQNVRNNFRTCFENWFNIGNSPSKVQPPNQNTECVVVGSGVGVSQPPVCWQWLSGRLTPCSYAISWGVRAWLSRRCAELLGASKSERLSSVYDARMEPER